MDQQYSFMLREVSTISGPFWREIKRWKEEIGIWNLTSSQIDESVRDGKMLKASSPWPEDIVSPEDDLPLAVEAVVVDEKLRWAAANERHPGATRASIDLALITDGKIIDLNRIPIPPDSPIIDRRFRSR